ncbi:hypothetical protein [Algoriphagus vanfongensis]|uniref:hypothetical protein n=1 Tax=Algoriphagus vanfongensis TaxID=426371 RepID=UPI0003FEE183|nr:hypothetical protein [Algoriphagus vanfongensis]
MKGFFHRNKKEKLRWLAVLLLGEALIYGIEQFEVLPSFWCFFYSMVPNLTYLIA